ncbi:MAG TPA: hypothetical protein V6C81_19200 [Planktothrix sp.]|jgi:hypothetical protein
MKPRRKKGATLGLIAVCVLVIIVIGVGCFFLAKLCGGGREVTNATDSGTLNVARAALRSKLGYTAIPAKSDFQALADPQYPGYCTLYTYNRIVAQALLVALNAQQENTGNALADAATVFGQLQTIGGSLATQLETQNNLQTAFDTVAGSNSLKMYGNNAITEQANGYQWAFMKVGGSTNIWFDPSVFPQGVNPASLNLVNAAVTPDFPPSKAGDVGAYQNKYMAGYQPITVNAVPNVGPFIGVPVFPQQTPHLVRLADFKDTNAADNYVAHSADDPPNAFSCQSTTQDSKSQTLGGAIAAAIVGCAYTAGVNDPATSPVDFQAAIPGGYILITNAAAGNYPSGWTGPTDMSNSIFNHELDPAGGEPGIQSVPVSSGPDAGNDVFTIDAGKGAQALADWSLYNAAGDPPTGNWTDSKGNTQTGPPQDSLNGVYVSGSGGSANPASAQDMKGMGTASGINCLTQDLEVNNWLTNPLCTGNAFQAFTNAYNRNNPNPGNGGGGPPPSTQMWSAVDGLKADIMQQYANVGWNGGGNDISISYEPTGTGPGGTGPGSTLSVSGAGGNSGQAMSTSAYSGMGTYKVGLNDPDINAAIQAGGQDGNPANDPWWIDGGGAAVATLNQQPLETLNPTVWALLNQVGSPCALNTVVADLVQRVDEIVPGTSQAQVQSLLTSGNAQLNMGSKLFIYKANPNDPTPSGGQIHGLVISSTPPTDAVSGTQADGSASAGACSATYGLSSGSDQGGLIDSFGNFVNGGDNNIHEQPFLKQAGSFNSTDHADFILSSGYQNLLGNLSFYQQVQGADSFSRPN